MSEFYDNFWQQIHAGGYKLADMLARIDLMVIAGRINSAPYFSSLLSVMKK